MSNFVLGMLRAHAVVFLVLLFTSAAVGGEPPKKDEDYYNRLMCDFVGGKPEQRPKADNVRVDCLTPEYAIETDWMTHKQYEGGFQALLYAYYTGRKAGVWLIQKKPRDIIHARRLVTNIKQLQAAITVWVIKEQNGIPVIQLYYNPGCHPCWGEAL